MILMDVSYLDHDHYRMMCDYFDQALSPEAKAQLIQVSIPLAKLAPRAVNRYRAACERQKTDVTPPTPSITLQKRAP